MASDILDWQRIPPARVRGGVITIGNFDGVHRGHLALLEQTQRQARSISTKALAFTFDPHPTTLLRPERAVRPLTTIQQRIELLTRSGVDRVVVLTTTPSLLELSAERFFQEVLLDRFQIRALVEGANFGFGRNREGDVQTLQKLCCRASIALTIAPPELVDGEPVSSSRIRTCIEAGELDDAERLLGRPYRLAGEVTVGQQRGRDLGFPTANLDNIETLLPADGVYAVRCRVGDDTWPGAANIGSNPTFGEHERKVEVHLIGFSGDLYSKTLEVDFVRRLRPTRPFAGKDELIEQLQRDIENATQAVLG